MAGHSQFKNIMHRKGAQDQKKAKLFTRLIREISVAAKSGSDPQTNHKLRGLMYAARAANVPKDRIISAINKDDVEFDSLDEVRYEGYGVGGAAFIVEALTDNRNRTASEVRSSFTKYGGALAETGSVSFMFKKIGVIKYTSGDINFDDALYFAIDNGAEDCIESGSGFEVVVHPDELHVVAERFDGQFGAPDSASIIWRAKNIIEINDDVKQNLMKILDLLENCDDVQDVFYNFII